jgi:uncharacterized protein YxjI
MAEGKAKFHKIGSVFKKKDKPGSYVALGNPNSKNEKYKTTVEITLKDAKGEKVVQLSNGFLTVLDPRKRRDITEEQASKIPEHLISELFIVEDGE